MDSVAAKFNMSTDALKRLNQLRTFSRGFNALQAGDELDVPLTPFPEIAWGENDPLPSVDNEREKNIAGIASRAGSFLANNPDTDAAVTLGNSMATTAASSEVQELLNRFGTARVQLETDKKLSLKNSQLDLLVPLYDRGDRVVFTQGSLHRTDDRNQSNLGVGIRHFISDYMLGVNTFGDYDLSREHARAGIGAEYWRDFVKLSANGYFRLTGWKDSPDVRDYDERPANGWDVRTQGWLPFAPQLGGKLTWEQYYGKDVALFGKNNRQRNPFAVTAGLEYTPIPLLSLNAEQRQGQSGKNDTRMGIGFNYQLGMPWHQQIDPSSVAAMRSLAGSRYDLVDRNNNIVLEYRQQEVLRISLPDVTEARSSELIRIPVTLHKDKYGLKETQWTSSPGFVEQGGTLQKRSEREIDVRIPAYTQGTRSGAAQEYTLTAVSFDNKGNRSNTASTIIRVSPSHHEMGELVVTPKIPVVADNSQFVSLTAAVNDESGLGVPGQQLTFSVSGLTDENNNPSATLYTDTQSNSKVLSVTTDADGKGTVMLRSKVAKKGSVTVTTDDGITREAQVLFAADANTAMISGLNVTKNHAHADGLSSNEIEAVVLDAQGNPLANFTVEADADNDGVVDTSLLTDAKGKTTLKITNERAGETNVAVRSGSATRAALSTTVHFVVDKSAAHIAEGDLRVTAGAKANGMDSNAVTIKVTDTRGNIAGGVIVDISAVGETAEATVTADTFASNDEGLVNAIIRTQTAGEYKVNASIRESGSSTDTTTHFIADQDSANITDSNLSVTSGAKADGQAGNAVVALVTDAQGNPVAKADVTFTADNTGVMFASAVVTTGDDGKASTTLTSTVAGKIIVTATVGNNAASKETAFIADRDTANITDSNLSVTSGAKADGQAGNAVVALVTDAQGNPVAKADVTFTADNTGVMFASAVVTTGDDGKASTTLTSTVAGKIIVTATVGNNAASKETAFVVGEAAFSRSEVAVDKDTYTSGDDVVVTVTLNDEHGNAVINQVDKLSSSTVDVNNATIKEGSSWQDEGRGKYIATFTAVKVTSSATAKLQLSDWDTGVTSLPYSIVAGEPVASTSTLTRNANGYLVNQEMIFTLILRDGNRNVVRMDPESVLSDATFKTPGSDTVINKLEMNSNGSYSFTITASVKGEDLQASFRLNGWASDIVTTNYDVMPVFRNVRGLHSRDTNMGLNHPKEGFYGAQFVLDLQGGGDRTDYNWRTNADWATVDGSGVVMLKTTIASHQAREVTVTATPKNGKTFGIIRHTFKLDRWISVYDNEVFYPDALEACASLNMRLPADARDGFSDFWGTKSKYEQSVIPSHIYTDSVRFWIKTTNNAAPYLWVRYLINGVYSGGAGISAKSRFLCIEDF
ncbi:inverse autotransporter beta domain-containing protein [Citrobacter freundii]|uniref:inverse autotransporter beta domain-containing protein n=1 Tax=Citrobacter freundii TaxID=546 RepID=UPI0015EAE2C3|nr:inverse autotransporter beta domain-containing protein [Citrobacter freundii]QLX26520.1 inverse autotransporter beta domain-containing protein [Citrobacter freundii]